MSEIKILKESPKGAMLITDGDKVAWIMPKMKRADGTFTKGAYEALTKSEKTLEENVQDAKDVVLDFCQIVRETDKAILVKLRLSFIALDLEKDVDAWFPKSRAKTIDGKLSVNSFFWKEKKAEVIGREKYYEFKAFDTYDNSYGVNAVTEELHTDQERRSKLFFPKSVCYLVNDILYVPSWIVDKKKEEKEDSMKTGAYQYVSTIHTHLNTNYEVIEPEIVACTGEIMCDGGMTGSGKHHSLGNAKELGIGVNVKGHDMIAKCDCGEKFTYKSGTEGTTVWECPKCEKRSHVVA